MAEMSPLRRRVIEDMTVRNLSPATQRSYVHAVAKFGRFFGRSPEELDLEDVRAFQVHLVAGGMSWPALNQTVCALRFLYGVTLARAEVPERIAHAREPQKLPVVLGADEVVRFLEAVPSLKSRAALTTAYAAGLRAAEAASLKVANIDSSRMVIRIEPGKGSRDRYVMLSPQLLGILREADLADRQVRTLCMTLAYAGCRLSDALALTADHLDLARRRAGDHEPQKAPHGGLPIRASAPCPAQGAQHGPRHPRAASAPGKSRGEHLWPWSRMTGWRAMPGVMEAAGLDGPHASPKGLRHGFDVAAVSAGIPLNLVQKWLGHAQLTTTAIYADAVGAEERDIAQKDVGAAVASASLQVLGKVLVHLEHGHLVLTEDLPELIVGQDLAAVLRVLQIMRLDVVPNLAHHRAPRQGLRSDYRSQLLRWLQRLLQRALFAALAALWRGLRRGGLGCHQVTPVRRLENFMPHCSARSQQKLWGER